MIELYKSIKKFVFGLYGSSLTVHKASRAKKLINIIYGILRAESCSLSKLASKIKGLQKFASKVRGIKRWLLSSHNTYDEHYEAFAKALLEALSKQGELVFAIDGSVMGDGCICLMVSVLFNGRALPICWISRVGKKGHFPEQMHVDVLKRLHQLVPEQTPICVLGDGEFDGCDVQKFCTSKGWKYVFRTAKDVILTSQDGEQFQLKDLDLAGQFCMTFLGVYFTKKQYGPVQVGFFHHEKYEDPIFLVSNMEELQEAFEYYARRFLIETFFSDAKSRGFHVNKSKLKHPERIDTLLIALCLAYVFVIQQALQADSRKLIPYIAFEDKNEASLFTLGRRMIDLCLENCLKIKFSLSIFVKSKFYVPL